MTTPQIIIGGGQGLHNERIEQSVERLERGKLYRDNSIVMVVVSRGLVPCRVVDSWMNLIWPMNNPVVRMFIEGMEVGAAYDQAVRAIFAHPQLSEFRYMLSVEEDNMPPPDGVLRLLESIDGHAAVGGLYWTKGDEGQPMIYGVPGHIPMFAPQRVQRDCLQECNGIGMGFTLFDLRALREMEPPYFETRQQWRPGSGAELGTQDLVAFARLRDAGHKIACDTRVKVGHLHAETGVVW